MKSLAKWERLHLGHLKLPTSKTWKHSSNVDNNVVNTSRVPTSFVGHSTHDAYKRIKQKIMTARVQAKLDKVVLPDSRNKYAVELLLRKKPVLAVQAAHNQYRGVLAEKMTSPVGQIAITVDTAAAHVTKREYLSGLPSNTPHTWPADGLYPPEKWKQIRARVRHVEWRESDEIFFRHGFHTAFQVYSYERTRAPWLEALIYNRATYSTRLREFRRWQFPREQKKYKWLQRVRKSLAPSRKNRYFKGRRWPQLRRYNQKLFYSLFNLRGRRATRRRFQKLNKQSASSVSNFIRTQKGLGTRLDVTLVHFGIAPSIYWARIVAPFGLLKVNNTVLYRADDQLLTADYVRPDWNRISRFQHYFKAILRPREVFQQLRRLSTGGYPTSFEYHTCIKSLFYYMPEEYDLRRSSRLQGNFFRWFKLDSV
jgi:hypothetical protein